MKQLAWDDWNKEHIKKHNVTMREVEEVYHSKFAEKVSYLGRKIYFGKTRKGRLLTVVVSFEKQKKAYVVSARDMSQKERREYYEKNKTDKTI